MGAGSETGRLHVVQYGLTFGLDLGTKLRRECLVDDLVDVKPHQKAQRHAGQSGANGLPDALDVEPVTLLHVGDEKLEGHQKAERSDLLGKPDGQHSTKLVDVVLSEVGAVELLLGIGGVDGRLHVPSVLPGRFDAVGIVVQDERSSVVQTLCHGGCSEDSFTSFLDMIEAGLRNEVNGMTAKPKSQLAVVLQVGPRDSLDSQRSLSVAVEHRFLLAMNGSLRATRPLFPWVEPAITVHKDSRPRHAL